MGLHYQLENNELGLCFECGLVIEGAESGCVAYTEAGMDELRSRKVPDELLQLFFQGYRLQHHAYFDVSEAEAAATLQMIEHYLRTGDFIPATATADMSFEGFEFASVLSPIFMSQVLASATAKESSGMIHQYLRDVWDAYEALQPMLSKEEA